MSNLVIPITGEPTVMAPGVQPDTVKAALRIMVDGQSGALVGVDLEHDRHFINARARRAVSLLTGVHIVLFGEVTLFDLDDDTIKEIMEDLA